MHKFGFSDSVLDVAKAVLDKKKPEELEEAKMPRQMKDPKKDKEGAYTFNLHTKNETIGEVWLHVIVEKKNKLSLQMWATSKKTYDKALNGGNKLSKLLSDAGLIVSSFELFNEERPGINKAEKDKRILNENIFSGSTVDIEA